MVRWGANGDGPADATGFAIALDILSVLMGTVAFFVVWTAQLWLPLPTELLANLHILPDFPPFNRTTPTGLLRLRFKFAKATAAEAVQPAIRAVGAILAFFYMPTVTGFVLAWAAAELAVAAALDHCSKGRRIDLSRVVLGVSPIRTLMRGVLFGQLICRVH